MPRNMQSDIVALKIIALTQHSQIMKGRHIMFIIYKLSNFSQAVYFFQTTISATEDKLLKGEGEVTQLRANLRQYEALVEEYRSQVSTM